MKLKYYLRGLGIGIIMTVIIMSFIRQPEKLTDAQIKLRALELGMVEKSVLADLQEEEKTPLEKEDTENESIQEETVSLGENTEIKNENEEIATENTEISEESNVVDSQKDVDVSEDTTEEQHITENQELVEETEESDEDISGNITIVGSFSESTVPVVNDIPQDEVMENYVVIFLDSGYSSEYACKKVYEAGLVDSWLELNRYLVRNGLDRSIRAGNHEIPVGASMEEIAHILSRQE